MGNLLSYSHILGELDAGTRAGTTFAIVAASVYFFGSNAPIVTPVVATIAGTLPQILYLDKGNAGSSSKSLMTMWPAMASLAVAGEMAGFWIMTLLGFDPRLSLIIPSLMAAYAQLYAQVKLAGKDTEGAGIWSDSLPFIYLAMGPLVYYLVRGRLGNYYGG